MAGPTQEEIQEYFDNQGSFGGGDNGDSVPSFDPFSSGGISTVGPSGTVYQEYKTLKAYLQTLFGLLPQGAVDYASSDLNGDGVNEVYAVDADGNPHTVYGYDDNNEVESTVYSDYLRDTIYGGTAPQTWDDIVKILKAEGYDDDAIEEVRGSIKCLTNANEIQCSEDEKFQGSVVLAGILNNSGYDGSWWDVRPTAGQPCQTDDGKQGEYDTNGGCTPNEYQEGDKCPTAPNGPKDGIIKDGQCVSPDTDGSDAEGPDCTVVTQENAEECGFTIDDSGNLVDKDRGDEDGIAPFYTNCGGGIWSDPNTECPDVGGVGEFCNDQANANAPECVEKGIQELIGEFGEAAVGTAQEVYDYIEDKIGEIKDNPLGVLREILTGGYMSGDERCWEGDMQSCDTANPDDGDICWKDCVNIVGVLGIPGIPMPPGMSDFGTVRDLEDFLKGIGKDIGDFIEDPAGTVEGWVEGIIDKIKGVFDSTADDASAIIDWLKGIFGASVGAWVWGQIEEEVTDTVFPNLQPYGLCPDGETPKQGPSNEGCPEPAVPCWDGTLVYKEEQCAEPPYGYCADGVTNKEDASGTNCPEYAEFGYCEDGTTKKEDSAGTNCAEYVPDYGMCDDGLTKKEDAEGTNCPGPEPEVNPGDPCDLEDEKTGSYEYVGDELQCLPDPPEFGFCQDGVTEKADTEGTNCPEYAPFGYCQDNQTKKEDASGTNCDEYSEYGYCGDGTTQKEDEAGSNCTEYAEPWENTGPTEEDCANNGKTFIPADPESQTASSCGDDIQLPWEDTGKTPEQCEAEGKLFIAGDPESQTPSSCGPCAESGYTDYGNGCEPEKGTGEGPDEGAGDPTECDKDPLSYECLGADEFCKRPENKGDNRCSTTVVQPSEDLEDEELDCSDPDNALACGWVECPDGLSMAPTLEGCEGTYTSPCNQQDRVTRDDGSCGECKPGFIEDPEGFDQCIQAPPECNDCTCAEYAASNPEECGIETLPPETTPPPSTGGGGGGGGGGGLSMEPFTVSGDPQLLGRQRFGAQDFLSPLFTGNQGGGLDFPIARFLQNKKGDIV